MCSSLLFDRSRLQLTVLYSSVIGGMLLLIGFVAHLAIQRAFERVVDRELHVFSNVINAKLESILQEPGQLPADANKTIPELCLRGRKCESSGQVSILHGLIHDGYHLQLLDLAGQPLAAIAEPPELFPANPKLLESQTIKNQSGEAFHLHLMSLKTTKGKHWGYLQVGRSVQKLDYYMRQLHLLLLVGVPTTMVLIGWVSWYLAGLAMQPISRSYAQMQEFTADAAHELKTPLAASQAIVETALADPQLSLLDSQQALQAVQRQTRRLNQLVQDLLFLARLDAQGMTKMDDPICLNDLVQDIEEELLPLAIAAQVDLTSQVDLAEQIHIKGNSSQLYRLISNLVMNGINYTPENGKVVVSLQAVAHYAVIQIEDTGIGIAAKDLPHLFDRFYRVSQDRSRTTGGSGLGLAIVWAIAKAHGGSVQVSSEVGKGSLFTVRLPYR